MKRIVWWLVGLAVVGFYCYSSGATWADVFDLAFCGTLMSIVIYRYNRYGTKF